MALVFFTIFLWTATVAMGVLAWRKDDGTFVAGFRDAARESLFIAPRVCVGIFGSGFIAELLPKETVSSLLGSGSGSLGILIASIAGAFVPGGPVVAFAIGAAALKAGAGSPQIMGFVVSWLLFSFNRTLIWELPVMRARFTGARILLSAPIPLIVGHLTMLSAG
ncbi:hypothetical protein [Roseibium aggregatum]|uniref:Permease n=1 Tax=Roseibium aggregatum TaxID=187304 RepID=A0A926NX12_9HYPH|nr:hypothetical protein [Roseibium aggregatum]MBD1545655.1 hypothetical protein [Roseibium aggregatum]